MRGDEDEVWGIFPYGTVVLAGDQGFLYKLFAVVAVSATSSGLHSPFQFTKIEILPPFLEKSITPENGLSCRD